jgi:hypothetical protein
LIESGDWVRATPQPWDRDKDLEVKAKAVSKEKIDHTRGTLDDRFGGSSTGSRSFL